MSLSLPAPSTRLLRAAAAEHGDLSRHREHLTRERNTLLGRLRQLDDALAAVDHRLTMLGALTAVAGADSHGGDVVDLTTRTAVRPDAAEDPQPGDTGHVLRGPAIREAAVQVLIDQPERIEALHYRRWYELLVQAGYSVTGKDPLAVFLTQVSRSPVVRKATKPGEYELDRQAPLQIRRRLEHLQRELRDTTLGPPAPPELAGLRTRRHELDLAISHEERRLEEALRVLRAGDRD
jgi:hypothetical protein